MQELDFEELREKARMALYVENLALNDLLNLNLVTNQEARERITPMIFETYLHAAIMRGIMEAIDKTKEALSEPAGELDQERLKIALSAQDQAESEAVRFYSQASQELEDGFLKDLFTAIAKDEESHHKIASNLKRFAR
ncbi:MAG: ferritin family protein [Thermoprotei archaeon]